MNWFFGTRAFSAINAVNRFAASTIAGTQLSAFVASPLNDKSHIANAEKYLELEITAARILLPTTLVSNPFMLGALQDWLDSAEQSLIVYRAIRQRT